MTAQAPPLASQDERVKQDLVRLKTGRPKAITAEHLPVIKELAYEGATDLLIAAYLNIDPSTLTLAKKDVNSGVLQAIKEGRREAILGQLKLAHGWAKKHVVGNIYRNKWLLGQFDPIYMDQQHVQHSGQVTFQVVKGISGPQSSQPAIEAEFTEVEGPMADTQSVGGEDKE